jgi:predicted nucleic acid-binding protein
MAPLIVIFDACVLYPAPLRDLLMHLAMTDLFRARWTNEIHEEWIRNVLKNRKDLTRKRLERTRDLMNEHVLDCVVSGYEPFIDGLKLPDNGDRHVLAAAIHAGASVIITFNLKHFRARSLAPLGIEAQHPDRFLSALLDANSVRVCSAIKAQGSMLKNPSMTAPELLDTLARQHLSHSVKRLQEFLDVL